MDPYAYASNSWIEENLDKRASREAAAGYAKRVPTLGSAGKLRPHENITSNSNNKNSNKF
jgi:hypothetical protein